MHAWATDEKRRGPRGKDTSRVPQIAIDSRYLRRRGVGLAVCLARLINDLLATEWRVVLLTDHAEHGEALRESFPSAEVAVYPCSSGFRWEQWWTLRYLYCFRPDIFIAPANWGVPLLYFGRTRLVVLVHDLIPIRLSRMYLFRDLRWSAKYLLSTLIAALRSDWVIANSRATASDVRHFWRKKRIRTVYPMVPAVPGAPPAVLLRPVSASPFVYTGGVDPRKNVHQLLKAFSLLRQSGDNRQLFVTGFNSDIIRPLISAYHLEESVVLTGYLSDEDVRALIRQAGALVYPSLMEGFGLPVIEALSLGIPVVCGPLPSLIELAGDLPHFTDVNDASAIAHAMCVAATDEARERLRAAAPAHFAALSQRKESQGWLPVLEEILEAGSRT